MENNVEYRRGLPIDYLSFMGQAHSNEKSIRRNEFIERVTELASKVVTSVAVDNGVDQMGKSFVHDTLPPYLTQSEKDRYISILNLLRSINS